MSLPSTPLPPQPFHLLTSITVNVGPPTWSYELFNNESQDGPFAAFQIKAFQLSVAAPISVVATPQGWRFDTDGSSYVLWFNPESGLPYPSDIAPGSSLGGFKISSAVADSGAQPAGLFTWDHGTDKAGPISYSTALVPVAPVLSSLTFLTPVPGGTVLTGTVTLSGITFSDVVVGLSSSDSSVVRLHRAVILPTGASSVTFAINTYPSDVTKMVTIQATLGRVVLTKDLIITAG